MDFDERVSFFRGALGFEGLARAQLQDIAEAAFSTRFVKGEIIRPVDVKLRQGMQDLEKISLRSRMAFEDFEREFQSYQDWPGIKPKPVEPVRVLDAH